MVQKGQYWKRDNSGHVWVRFIFHVEGDECHFLEYVPNGVVPHRGSENFVRVHMDEYWEKSSLQEAQALIVNLDKQDEDYAYRLGKKSEAESLAKALKILEHKSVHSVSMHDNVIRVSTENGAEYEIAIGREGYTSRQTCLPDPW